MSQSGLLIIDGTATLVRAQLASRVKSGPSDNQDDLALFFFVRSVIRYLKYHKPEYVVVAWDGRDAKEWRREKYPEYKRNRPDGPSGWLDEDSVAMKAEAFCIRLDMYSIRGPFEADDVIAWAVWMGKQEGFGVVGKGSIFIRSDDADMNQLVTGTIVRQFPLSGDGPVTDENAVWAKYGCMPDQLPMLRALAGDSSDNIPGVPGIGLKTAAKVLADAGYDLRLVEHKNITGHPEMRRQVFIFEEIMDLLQRREAVHRWLPPMSSIHVRSRWDPQRSLPDARALFEYWDMKSLVTAVDNGSLW
jgi:DNA polymerase-1